MDKTYIKDGYQVTEFETPLILQIVDNDGNVIKEEEVVERRIPLNVDNGKLSN